MEPKNFRGEAADHGGSRDEAAGRRKSVDGVRKPPRSSCRSRLREGEGGDASSLPLGSPRTPALDKERSSENAEANSPATQVRRDPAERKGAEAVRAMRCRRRRGGADRSSGEHEKETPPGSSM